jgi:hypothetical protein
MPGDDEILRIAAQFDVGSITAGVEEAANAVRTGTARMNDSFTNLAAAQIRVASANKDLRDTLSGTVSKGLTPTTAATEEVAAAMFEAKIATDAFKTAQEEAYGATQRLSGGVNNARIGFTGLTQDLGLHGSRALGSFIAQSETLGPILQAAFPIIAAVAFFEILDTGYHKLLDVTAAMAGWDEETKQMYEHLVDLNQEQVKFNAQLDIEKLALGEIGLKGSALDQQKLLDLKIEQQIVQDKFNESLARETEKRRELDELKKPLVIPTAPDISAIASLFPGIGQDKDKIARVNKELEQAITTTAEWGHQLERLKEVTIPKTGMEEVAKATEEAQKAAQKYADALEKLYDQDVQHMVTQAREEKHVVDQRIAEQKRLAEESERLEEELSKTTLDLAKKDLETFESNLVRKTRLQEQAGKEQIEQLRVQAEMQQRHVEATSFFGAADPRLIQMADAALDQQAFKIMDLIALEEQLRQKLLQTGMLETDPKILESFERQQQLVQQLNIAVQKYDQQIQKLNDETAKKMVADFQSAMKSITSDLNHNVTAWITGQEKFGQASVKVWQGVVDSALQALLKMAEQEILAVITPLVAAIPIVGPFLAAGLAGGAGAMIGGGGGGGSSGGSGGGGGGDDLGAMLGFAGGGIMGDSASIALLHPREMVLPSQISQSVQQMAAHGSSGGGAGVVNHFHTNINIGGNPSSSDISKMEKQMVAMVKRARRRGSFD